MGIIVLLVTLLLLTMKENAKYSAPEVLLMKFKPPLKHIVDLAMLTALLA